MYDYDRAPVTRSQTHHKLEASERTINKPKRCRSQNQLSPLKLSLGIMIDSRDSLRRLAIYAWQHNMYLPARDAGITTLK